ncbi:MAG: hypothetical protein COB60_00425 [Flavobacteriaceae bacterium]|nr:MAG: hypothetical protein COB60_00425 [Flavobacteriaceae bacterium]
MIRRIVMLMLVLQCTACAELQQVINQLPIEGNTGLGNAQIAAGLKQALDNGITKQVSTLALKDGFNKNSLVKILLPEELQRVDKTLRSIGLSHLADEGLKVLNRAAEDAVSEAIPVFVSAIKGMTFNDAKQILLGDNMAATNYLKSSTTDALYQKFNPIIKNSFQKVGADQIWENLITKYNSVPFVKKVNPDLTDYVTNQALSGVFKMVAVEEKNIRTKISARNTDLLRKVFALQDKVSY